MSGGEYNYIYREVEYLCSGNMHDEEMDQMIRDLVKVLHDVEWWQSGDIDEKCYRKTVQEFKKKWFGTRDEKLRESIAKKLDRLAERLREENL